MSMCRFNNVTVRPMTMTGNIRGQTRLDKARERCMGSLTKPSKIIDYYEQQIIIILPNQEEDMKGNRCVVIINL